jgi:hypothetical protein
MEEAGMAFTVAYGVQPMPVDIVDRMAHLEHPFSQVDILPAQGQRFL